MISGARSTASPARWACRNAASRWSRRSAAISIASGNASPACRRVAGLARRRVLMVVGHRPLIVAGGGTLQDELVRTAGGVNVAADVGSAFPQVPLELVAARAPDVIVDAAMGTEAGGRSLFADLS